MEMGAIMETATLTPRPSTPRIDRTPAVCGCGQYLDVCPGEHCSRCGTQLGPLRFEATGFWQAA